MAPSNKLTVFLCIYLCCCSLPSAFAFPGAKAVDENADAEMDKTQDPLKERIGIIGGGPSGLFAARELVRKGYTKVTVLEKATENFAGITRSIEVDGRNFDLTTRFISAVNFDQADISANLKEMIDDYNLALTLPPPISYLNLAGPPQLFPGPHIFAPFPDLQIVTDLIWGFELLKTVKALGSITACHAAGIASPGESFHDFALRVNKPVFTEFSEYLQDLFLGGRAVFQPACLVLNVRARFMAGDIATVLKLGGLTSAAPFVSPELGALLDLSFEDLSRKIFVDGYDNFFTTLVQQEGIDARLGAEVTTIEKKSNGKFKVTVTGSSPTTYNFDKIIVATRPCDSFSFLPNDAPIVPLYNKAFSDPVFVLLARTEGVLPLMPDAYTAVLYPQAFLVGTAVLPYNGVPIAAAKFYPDVNATVTIGFANPGQTIADLEAITTATYAAQGVNVVEFLNSEVYNYVSDVSAADSGDGFFEDIEALQGVDGYYYVSEAMAGSGVSAVLDYAQATINQYF